MKLSDAPTFLRVMITALADSNETLALLTGEEISSVDRMKALVPTMRASDEGRALLRDRSRSSPVRRSAPSTA